MKPKLKKKYQPVNPATVLLVRQLIIGFGLFLLVAIVLATVWYVTRLPALTITQVHASGGSTIRPVIVEDAVTAVLEGSYLKLVPRRFVYLYPEDEVLAAVRQVERIKDVAISRSATELVVTYDEYTPDALWCAEQVDVPCVFLDETGYAFGQAPNLSGGSLLRYYTLQAAPELAQRPFTEEDYQLTKTFVTALAETGWYVETIEIDAVRDVFYGLVGGGELKATLQELPERTLSFLNTIRQSEQFSHLQPDNFSYIDLRFGTKVFVNETRDSELGTTTATTTEVFMETDEEAGAEIGSVE